MVVSHSSASPASSAGVIYQFERALLQLASAPPESQVALEALDDIAIESVDGEEIFAIEQDSHNARGA